MTSLLIGATTGTIVAVGQGNGPIVLTGVECNGLESKLLDCPNGGRTRTSYCTHAAVTCAAGMFTLMIHYYDLNGV